MEIKRLVTGTIEENCYLLSKGKEALIVDPGADTDKIIAAIDQKQVRPIAILLTHTHYDHIGAVDELRARYVIPLYVHPAEKEWLGDPSKNLSADKRKPVTAKPAEKYLVEDTLYQIGLFHFKVLHTPGHSPGGVSFWFEDEGIVLTGDALFGGSIGRTDLSGSEPEKLIPSIQRHLFTLPDETIVYPGHREKTTIGHEKKSNPYFQ